MYKDDLIRRVTAVLKEKGYTKHFPAAKHTFTITDDSGHSRDFTVKDEEREMMLNQEDVRTVLLTMTDVIKEALSTGEPIIIRGFCTLFLNYRKPRASKEPGTEIWHSIPGRWVPKIKTGSELVECARRYETEILQDGKTIPDASTGN